MPNLPLPLGARPRRWTAWRAAACLAVMASLTTLLRPCAQAAPAVPDTMAQRVVACSACHGKEGRSTNEGYFPRIAGKPAGYLYNQLVNFREGRRTNPAMTHLIDHLSDAYLHEIADHFASLDLPYPAPQPTRASPEELARGETLVRRGDAKREVPACEGCHGKTLTGAGPTVPGLVGLPRDYLIAQLSGWRIKQRRALAPDCMSLIASRLSAEDVSAVVNWIATQPVPANAHAAADVQRPLPLKCGSIAP